LWLKYGFLVLGEELENMGEELEDTARDRSFCAELENMGEELENTADNDGTCRRVHEEAFEAEDSSSMRRLSRQNARSFEAEALEAEDGETLAEMAAAHTDTMAAMAAVQSTRKTRKSRSHSSSSSPCHRVDAAGRRISRFWSEEPERGLTDAFRVSAVSSKDTDSMETVAATVCDRCEKFRRRGDEELEAMGDITCCCKPIDQELEAMGIPVEEAETFQLEAQSPSQSPPSSSSSKRAKWATPSESPAQSPGPRSPSPSSPQSPSPKQVEYF
jgi:hypothetical protein